MFGKIMFWKRKKISSLSVPIKPEELRKRVKILVVDDNEEHFPYQLLRDNGYTIEWWGNVTSDKLERMERGDFDIIILDIKGITDNSVSESEGLGILKRIKSVNPAQVVVAFSGHSFDLNKTEFWRLADDTLSKPVSIVKAKELIDRLINEKITITNYWNAIKTILISEGAGEKEIKKIEQHVINSIEKQSFNINDIKKKIAGSIQNVAAIITLINAIYRLWNY